MTYCPFCNLIGLQCTLQREQLALVIIRPRPLCLMLIKFSAYRAGQSSVFFSFSSASKYGRICIGWRLWTLRASVRVWLSETWPPTNRPENEATRDYNWGERERTPNLLMSMEITLRMRERCSNSADLAGFGAVCFWSRKCHGGVRVV